MRATSIILHCAILSGIVSARDAYLFTFDRIPQTSTGQPSILSSETAYTIIQRRRGNSENRYLAGISEEALDQINSYSGYQQPLFQDANDDAPRSKLFLQIAGYDDDVLESSLPYLTISNVGLDFITDITSRESEYCVYGSSSVYDYSLIVDGGVENTYDLMETGSCSIMMDFFSKPNASPLGELSTLLQELESPSDGPKKSRKILSALINVLGELAASNSLESTLLLLPSSRLYEPKYNLARRDEEPLDLPLPDISYESPPSHIFAPNMTVPSNLPACFSSQSACENATNSCLGHGSCKKLHGSSSCYKCACTSTVIRENADGSKKTQQWGGAACQKKDVSVPFFLFASFGVVMSALVFGVIGMLYSMGGEELPSVIGAGVAGPRAQK